MRIAIAIAMGLVAVLGLVGCAGNQEDAVLRTAQSFDEALQAGDAVRACEALAPSTRTQLEADAGQPCAQALVQQDLVALDRVTDLQRFGRQASIAVHSSDGATDTWFLSRFDDRWLLVAMSCAPRAQQPYDCDVEGP